MAGMLVNWVGSSSSWMHLRFFCLNASCRMLSAWSDDRETVCSVSAVAMFVCVCAVRV